MTTHYVSFAGAGAANGTSVDNAWAYNSIGTTSSGDTIIWAAEAYDFGTTSLVIAKVGVTHVATGATFDVTGCTSAGYGLNLQGADVTWRGGTFTSGTENHTGITLSSNANNFVLEKISITGPGLSWDYTAKSNVVSRCIQVAAPSGTIRECVLSDAMHQVLVTSATSTEALIIRDNTMTLARGTNGEGVAANLAFASASVVDFGYRCLIQHNTMSDFMENAIDLGKATNVVVEDNRLVDDLQTTSSASAIFVGSAANDSSGNIIRRNFIDNIQGLSSSGSGINTRGAQDAQIYGNIITNCINALVDGNGADNSIMTHNYLGDCSRALFADATVTTCQFRNNICDNMAFGTFISVTVGGDVTVSHLWYETGKTIDADATDGGNHVVGSDPGKIGTADFRLQGDSLCIGAGTHYWTPTNQPHGYDGLRFPIRSGRGPDMGAFPVRPGLDGAVRGTYTLPASYLEGGSEVSKAKQAP